MSCDVMQRDLMKLGLMWRNVEQLRTTYGTHKAAWCFSRFLPRGPAQASGTALTKKAAQVLFTLKCS